MTKPKALRRQIFVLTPEEKKAAACIVAALILGVGTKQYRAEHPRPPLPATEKQQLAAKVAAKREAARARSARGQTAAAHAAQPPLREVEEEE